MYILYWNATSPNKQLTHGITNPIAYLSLVVMPCVFTSEIFHGVGRKGGKSNDHLLEDWTIYWVHE